MISVIDSRRLRWTDFVVHIKEMRHSDNSLIVKIENKKTLGRTKLGRENLN
jgi:hypothetical protein